MASWAGVMPAQRTDGGGMRALLYDERAATAAEYALIIAIIGAAIAAAALTLGGAIADSMNSASNVIENCSGNC